MATIMSSRQATLRSGSSARPALSSRRTASVRCSATQQEPEVARRAVLLAGAAVLASPLVSLPAGAAEGDRIMPVENLGSFQRNAQREAFRIYAQEALKKVLTAEDAPAAVRLAFNEAATYDLVTKTGGFDGSIVTSGELSRPENAGLKPLVERLKVAKADIDAWSVAQGSAPISWADVIVLAGKIATQKSWYIIKAKRAANADDAKLIESVYGAPWPVQLGRVDSTEPAPAGRVPAQGAPVAEIKAFLYKLGAKPGQDGSSLFSPKPPFWERPGFIIWTATAEDPAAEEARLAAADPAFAETKAKYDGSRRTLTRTDYEVDFINAYTKLVSLGAKFDDVKYLHTENIGPLKL